jgi:dienelactone hydrolase
MTRMENSKEQREASRAGGFLSLRSLRSLRLTGFPVLVILLFLGALFWAKGRDPFIRKWFTLNTADHSSVKCIAVLPKPLRQYPVIIYAHGSGGSLMTDGNDLRQIAELGLAAVSLEYNQTNEAAFAPQLEALLCYLSRQKWANTNAVAWVGFSLGANRMLDFALHHPERQPQLLVQLSGAGVEDPAGKSEITDTNSTPSTLNHQPLTNLHCPVLFVQSEQDEIFPIADTKRLVSILQTNGLPVELKIISGLSHGMEPERGVVFRCVGEYCLTHLGGKDAWQNYHSIARWQAEANPLWLFCLPAAAWVTGWLIWLRRRKTDAPERIKLKRHEIALRWLAGLLAAWALAVTAIHLVPPHLAVTDRTLNVARKFLVQPKEHSDFEFLAAQPIWRGQKLKTLLTHVELAGYNRSLINWKLDEDNYRDYVLSPIIELSTLDSRLSSSLHWRRPLWEEFYPRIRRESSPEDAARIVVRHLRERVTIADLPDPPHDVPVIWLRQITDEAGFELIYVAALRSVGVPARLNSQQQAEFWDGAQWRIAPAPSVTAWGHLN